MLLTTEQ